MAPHFTKFKELLRELFMMDQADLNFGIYRIMNQKRAEITDYLDNKLKNDVDRYLDEFSGKSRSNLKNEIDKLANSLTEAGVRPESSSKYNNLKRQLEEMGSKEELEGSVYSHLTLFFKRYYDKGDFISLRRYKKDVYALPYEGEEVKLYWANSDQYYVKSSEYFKNYSFNIHNGKNVSFELVEASTEQNNNKIQGDKERRFALYNEKPLEEVNGELKIYLTYEPTDKKVSQKELTQRALRTLTPMIPPDFYDLFIKRPSEKDPDRTLLEKHLTDYVVKNTFDYFIHKDLGAFLRRELDFYIKNEILCIDDLEYEDENRLFRQLSVVKTIKKIGHNLIQFLASIEDFQKKLWLKKKFVVESNYCITLDRVPEEFYAAIAANDAQREEWIKLFAIDEIGADTSKLAGLQTAYSNPLSVEFIKENPYLVLDTAFFDDEFKHKLIGSIDDIDDNTDGLLILSENFQALNLLQEKYTGKLHHIHIDPPYNTATSGFLYKNAFKHSSWMTMMANRIQLSESLMNSHASFTCHIDENEYEYLWQIFDTTYLNNLGTIIWDKRNPMTGGGGLATQHEYIIWRSNSVDAINLSNNTSSQLISYVRKLIDIQGGVNELVRKSYSEWISSNPDLTGGEKAYRYIDDNGRIYQSVSLRAPEPRFDPKFHQPLIHPITGKPCPVPPNGFSRTPETLAAMISEGVILFGEDEKTQPRQKMFLSADTRRQMSTVLQDAKKGKAYTEPMGINFPYCHPTSLYETLLGNGDSKNDMILDFFAGSGTTGHAVINLNREDGGARKYILVEMGEYFDTVTKPRIQKVIYSKDWKNGKPVSRQGSSHCFKYVRLESYEDTLNNLAVKTNDFAQALNEYDGAMKESFLLNYMLDTETKGSLFNTEWFADPFGFQLNITHKNELRPEKIDLVDTFNYLIGLNVHSIAYPVDGVCTVTGVTRRGEKTFILWRDTHKIPNDKLNSIVEKLNINPRENEFDRIYCNGNNNLERIRKKDQTWKVILTEQEFAKRMFEIE